MQTNNGEHRVETQVVSEQPAPILLSADRPVTDPGGDRLGHAPFARHLARGIARIAPPEGMVIGLYAPWGAGKTTILGFVEHFLREDYTDEQRPIVVRFNPWWFSSQADIVRKFFVHLELVLRRSEETSTRQLGECLADDMTVLAASVAPLGEADVVRAAAGKPVTGDIPHLKEQIGESLRASGKRILVIIDDIDRLATAAEIRQVFQAVKAVADFPGIVYLLAFDKESVTRALDQERGAEGFGAAYLEKIVQAPFEMPLPDPADVHQLLFERLDVALSATPDGLFSDAYWTDMFHQGIAHFIRTPRDAVRLANAVHLTYAAVVGEVNPVDFIAIETLRVFMPKVYDTIRIHKSMFAGNTNSWNGRDIQKELRAFHEGWLADEVPPAGRDVTRKFVTLLFPKLQCVWHNTWHGHDSEMDWRRQLKVSSSDIFPIYFRLAVPSTTISRGIVVNLLARSGDAAAFADALRALSHQPYSAGTVSPVRKALQRFLDFTDRDIPAEHIRQILTALFEVADELGAKEPARAGMYDFGIDIDLGRVVLRLIRRLPEQDRFDVLAQIFAQAASTEFVIHEIAVLSQEHGRVGGKERDSEENRIVTTEHMDALEQVGLERIRAMVAGGTLMSVRNSISILYRWSDWGGPEEPRAWAETQAGTDAGLLSLLEHALGETYSQSMDSLAVQTNLRLDPNLLEPFLPAETIVDRIRGLAGRDDLPERQAAAVKQYLKENTLRQRGLNPDFARHDDE